MSTLSPLGGGHYRDRLPINIWMTSLTQCECHSGFCPDSLTQAARRLAGPLSLLALLLVVMFTRTRLPDAVYVLLIVCALGAVYSRMAGCDYRTFMLYILAFGLFNGLRTVADFGSRTSFAYPMNFDASLFGQVPTVWLQDHLYHVGRFSPLDWATVSVYTTYFWAHFAVAILVWVFRRDLLSTYVRAIVGVLFVGLAVYVLVPTSPPWLAGETGHLPEVARITKLATSSLWADAHAQGTYIAGTNDVAAMPSLHTALTATIAMTAWRINKAAGVLGWAYLLAMGFSLIYTGEHYFLDVSAGAVTAIVVWRMIAARSAVRGSVTFPLAVIANRSRVEPAQDATAQEAA